MKSTIMIVEVTRGIYRPAAATLLNLVDAAGLSTVLYSYRHDLPLIVTVASSMMALANGATAILTTRTFARHNDQLAAENSELSRTNEGLIRHIGEVTAHSRTLNTENLALKRKYEPHPQRSKRRDKGTE